ncbi:MAG TPA: histidine kinase dimerization/phospho-acceptor domain-containing protein, partial [candidate division Zixibacteria bacterium]|nr:histidine kinase dimerization/phospho-acceptor domain-containing protein [candidate division Zixibacteria bacterium]
AFDGDPPLGAFTVPLYRGPRILGAALGVRVGEAQLIKEDHFLESLAAAISLAVIAQIGAGGAGSVDQRRIDDERLKAALEVAVTVNHEINNPLTAALGNVQLILMQKDKLDPDLRRKLEVVEKSALQIRDVTQRLLSLTEARSTTYAGDETMIDLNANSANDHDSASDTDSGKRKK